ncbi:MAG TPA: hypothetical protein VEP90_26250, partial [Methylomirabilota bacterium]|nr:hypothetical protein [Methylomirabilota bacterium]
RLGAFKPYRHMVPSETRHYARVAHKLGLRTRFEILSTDYVLKGSRGFVEHEDTEAVKQENSTFEIIWTRFHSLLSVAERMILLMAIIDGFVSQRWGFRECQC